MQRIFVIHAFFPPEIKKKDILIPRTSKTRYHHWFPDHRVPGTHQDNGLFRANLLDVRNAGSKGIPSAFSITLSHQYERSLIMVQCGRRVFLIA
jgi:hypothetical protein